MTKNTLKSILSFATLKYDTSNVNRTNSQDEKTITNPHDDFTSKINVQED